MIDGRKLAEAGFAYLGVPYSAMDCQAFVEQCLRDCGLRIDLAGSNAWYREVMKNGEIRTPEECMKCYGKVPAGAFLFILARDGKEPEKYKPDRLGNASHIGIATGKGEGAIHSSSSRGCVAESRFAGKTIPGGWNRVGLWNRVSYEGIRIPGETGNADLPENVEGERMIVTVWSENGGLVNLRKRPDKSSALVERYPPGTEAELLESGTEWCRIRVKGKTGWMMTRFLAADERAEPAKEDPAVGFFTVTVRHLTEEQADAVLREWPEAMKEKEM